MPGLAVVRATMLLATVCWASVEVLKLRRPREVAAARRLWTAGAALAVVHAVVAFDVAYGWNHQAALTDTARRTAAVTGVSWGGGLFVNYTFLALWVADACWWWLAPGAYLRRPLRMERARAALFLFMFVNGAIVFAGGPARAVGVPAVAAVCLTWVLDARRHPARA